MSADPQLTIGMATYDDFDGVYFSVQALRLYHAEVMDQAEIVVIDNHPSGPHGEAVKDFLDKIPNGRYLTCTRKTGTVVRELLFHAAQAPHVLSIDCHVLLVPGAVARLMEYFRANPRTNDLLHGPLLRDGLNPADISTHMEPRWHDFFYGQWAQDERGMDPEGEPFEVPLHGMGLFSCRREAWVGFNRLFVGFGGEEGYIHEKFRQAGSRPLCLPWLRWLHRFPRPGGVPYPMKLQERAHNYFVGWLELGWDPEPIIEHFQQDGGREKWDVLLQMVRDAYERPDPSEESTSDITS